MVHLYLCAYEDKERLANMIQLYYYDLATCSKLANITHLGGYYQSMPYFENYWKEDGCYPYLIKHNDTFVGFSFVHTITVNETLDWKLAEFFVMRPFSGQGIGQAALTQLLRQHPGRWEISVLIDNQPARLFWKKALANRAVSRTHEQFPNYIFYETVKGWC